MDTLRSMMTRETWMTGREALDKGFADAIKEDEDDPDMSMSCDRKVLYVNGIGHNVAGLRNIPGTIPTRTSAKPAARLATNKRPANKAANSEGGKTHMTLDELKAQEPDLVSQIEQAATNAAKAQASWTRRAVGSTRSPTILTAVMAQRSSFKTLFIFWETCMSKSVR